MGWIFTCIIWGLLIEILLTNSSKTRKVLTVVQVIVLIIQIIYTMFKN